MRWKESCHPYAMITILFWSLAYVLTRLALRHFTALPLGFLRYAVASAALIAVVRATRAERPRREDLKWFLAAGGSGFFLYMIAFNKGCETVTASTSSIIIATVPVMTALLAGFVYRETLRPVQWCAIGVEFAGVTVLTLSGGGFSVNRGVALLLAAAVCLSVYNLLQRRLTKRYSPLTTCAYSVFSGTAMLCLFLPGSMGEVSAASPVQLLYVLLLGVFSSAVAFVSWSHAMAKARKTSTVSNYMFLTPFLTSLLGFWMAGERPEGPALAGGAVILSGLFLFRFGDTLYRKAFRRPSPR